MISTSTSDSTRTTSRAYISFEDDTVFQKDDVVLYTREIKTNTNGHANGCKIYLVEDFASEEPDRYLFVSTPENNLFRWSTQYDGSLSKFARSLYQDFVIRKTGKMNNGNKTWKWILTIDECNWLHYRNEKCSKDFLKDIERERKLKLSSCVSNDKGKEEMEEVVPGDDEEMRVMAAALTAKEELFNGDFDQRSDEEGQSVSSQYDHEWRNMEEEAEKYEKEATRLIEIAKNRRDIAEKGRIHEQRVKRTREEFEENCRKTQDLLMKGLYQLQELHTAFQTTMTEQARVSETLKKSRIESETH